MSRDLACSAFAARSRTNSSSDSGASLVIASTSRRAPYAGVASSVSRALATRKTARSKAAASSAIAAPRRSELVAEDRRLRPTRRTGRPLRHVADADEDVRADMRRQAQRDADSGLGAAARE